MGRGENSEKMVGMGAASSSSTVLRAMSLSNAGTWCSRACGGVTRCARCLACPVCLVAILCQSLAPNTSASHTRVCRQALQHKRVAAAFAVPRSPAINAFTPAFPAALSSRPRTHTHTHTHLVAQALQLVHGRGRKDVGPDRQRLPFPPSPSPPVTLRHFPPPSTERAEWARTKPLRARTKRLPVPLPLLCAKKAMRVAAEQHVVQDGGGCRTEGRACVLCTGTEGHGMGVWSVQGEGGMGLCTGRTCPSLMKKGPSDVSTSRRARVRSTSFFSSCPVAASIRVGIKNLDPAVPICQAEHQRAPAAKSDRPRLHYRLLILCPAAY